MARSADGTAEAVVGKERLELLPDRVRLGRPDPSAQSFAVIAPLKAGPRESVPGLLEQGPPFDTEALQLARHQVFLSSGEAVFVFDAPPETLDKLLADPIAWSAAATWRDSVAGFARIAEEAYSWGGFTLDRVDAGESTTPGR
jgi:hypothetical protein